MAEQHGGDEYDPLDFGGRVDMNTFEQILDMDEDDDNREFSKGIVYDFFAQADQTFKQMDDALTRKDLASLSSLGHFLKGSSATLGLITMKQAMEHVQQWGMRKSKDGQKVSWPDSKFLELIMGTLEQVKEEYHDIERQLKDFYEGEDEE